MKLVKKFIAAACLVGCTLKAANPNGQDDPYQNISQRNLFALSPSLATNDEDVITPPVQITLNGIITIFGDKRALFKTQAAMSPLSPAKGKNYMLTEGQRDGEIELLAVDVVG